MLMLVPGIRRAVAVQSLGQLLVDVDHQRVFLRRVEVLGLGDDRAQGLPVRVDVLHQLCLAPDVIALLGIGVRDFLHVAEARVADPEVRELVEPRLREDHAIGVPCLDHGTEGLVHHDDFFGRGVAGVGHAIEPAALGLVVVGREQDRLVGGNRAFFGVERPIAVDDLVLAPVAGGQHARARAVWLDFPDVVLVVEEDRRVFRGPARRAVGRRQARRIVILAPEVEVELRGQVDLDAVRDPVGEPVGLALIEIQQIPAGGRHRRVPAKVLQDRLPLPGLEVDEPNVVVGRVPRHLASIAELGRADGAGRILALDHVGKVGRRELDEPFVGPLVSNVHDRAIRAIALLLRADALHRLKERVLPVPEVDTARCRRAFRRGRCRGRRGTDEESLAVLGKPRRSLVAHDHSLRHATRCRRRELGGGRVARPSSSTGDRVKPLCHTPPGR